MVSCAQLFEIILYICGFPIEIRRGMRREYLVKHLSRGNGNVSCPHFLAQDVSFYSEWMIPHRDIQCLGQQTEIADAVEVFCFVNRVGSFPISLQDALEMLIQSPLFLIRFRLIEQLFYCAFKFFGKSNDSFFHVLGNILQPLLSFFPFLRYFGMLRIDVLEFPLLFAKQMKGKAHLFRTLHRAVHIM